MKGKKRFLVLGFIVGVVISSIISVILFNNYNSNNKNYYYSQKLKASNKSIVLIGDSDGINHDASGAAGNGNNWIGWADTFKILFPDIPTYTRAVAGSGFFGAVSEKFIDQLNNLESKINNKNEITDIIVLGGYNDVTTDRSEDDLNKAVLQFCERAKELMPNAKISFMYTSVDFKSQIIQNRLNEYEDVFRRVCQNNNVNFVENSSDILDSKELMFWDQVDPYSGFHPSTKGSMKIVGKIVEYLVNNKIE